eukprot:TRINITY_DN1958_c0_g1_i1.p1 TRINITY_DN1958_c0_g1~~TRINITY_DN1958_c0_g1_i1.p1  ORF type:complete len:1618 (+),score=627.59 TRINITY_DN1958_c0_g1_i1:434-5287(+)
MIKPPPPSSRSSSRKSISVAAGSIPTLQNEFNSNTSSRDLTQEQVVPVRFRMNDGSSHEVTLPLSPSTTILEVKQRLEFLYHMQAIGQFLTYNGRGLADSTKLVDIKYDPNHVIFIVYTPPNTSNSIPSSSPSNSLPSTTNSNPNSNSTTQNSSKTSQKTYPKANYDVVLTDIMQPQQPIYYPNPSMHQQPMGMMGMVPNYGGMNGGMMNYQGNSMIPPLHYNPNAVGMIPQMNPNGIPMNSNMFAGPNYGNSNGFGGISSNQMQNPQNYGTNLGSPGFTPPNVAINPNFAPNPHNNFNNYPMNPQFQMNNNNKGGSVPSSPAAFSQFNGGNYNMQGGSNIQPSLSYPPQNFNNLNPNLNQNAGLNVQPSMNSSFNGFAAQNSAQFNHFDHLNQNNSGSKSVGSSPVSNPLNPHHNHNVSMTNPMGSLSTPSVAPQEGTSNGFSSIPAANTTPQIIIPADFGLSKPQNQANLSAKPQYESSHQNNQPKMNLRNSGDKRNNLVSSGNMKKQLNSSNNSRENERGHRRNPSKSQQQWLPKNRNDNEVDLHSSVSSPPSVVSPSPSVETQPPFVSSIPMHQNPSKNNNNPIKSSRGGGGHRRNPSINKWVPKVSNVENNSIAPSSSHSLPFDEIRSPSIRSSGSVDFSSLQMPSLQAVSSLQKKEPSILRSSLLAPPIYFNSNDNLSKESKENQLAMQNQLEKQHQLQKQVIQQQQELSIPKLAPPSASASSPRRSRRLTTNFSNMNLKEDLAKMNNSKELFMPTSISSSALMKPSQESNPASFNLSNSSSSNGSTNSGLNSLANSTGSNQANSSPRMGLNKTLSITSFVSGVEVTAPSSELESLFTNFFSIPGYLPPISAFPPVTFGFEEENNFQGGNNSPSSNASNFQPEEEIIEEPCSSKGTSYRHSTAEGQAMSSSFAGSDAQFIIVSRDSKGNQKTSGGDSYEVILHGSSLVPAKVVDNRDGTYSVSYRPLIKGIYDMFVGLEGLQIANSPFSVVVTSGPAYPPQSVAAGEGLASFKAGEGTLFFIQARDQYGNARDSGGDRVSVELIGPQGSPQSHNCPIVDAGNGTYSVEMVAKSVGFYRIVAKINGEEISGSPFSTVCIAGTSFPSKCSAMGIGLSEGVVGNRVGFMIQSADAFGNKKNGGGDDYKVSLKDPKGTKPPVHPTVTDNNNGTYSVSYTPDQSGTMELSITLFNRHIMLSPFKINVKSSGKKNEPVIIKQAQLPSRPPQLPPKNLTPSVPQTEMRAILRCQSLVRRWLAKRYYLDIMRKYAYRSKVAFEILSTEKTYIESLTCIKEQFFDPLRQSLTTNKPILSNDKLGIIFSNFHLIRSINLELHKRLEERIKNWGPHQNIGDVFVNVAPSLQFSYSHYVNNYDQALKAVSLCQEKEPAFKAFLEKQRSVPHPSLGQINFGSLLIAPVQRLPRYELLLSEMVKYTPQDHEDFDKITLALIKIKDVTEFVNNNKRKAENLQKILSIQSSLDGNVKSLFHLNRLLVDEGTFNVVVGGKKLNKVHIYLFNDMVMVAKPQKDKGIKFHSLMMLDKGYVQPLSTVDSAGDQGSFKISQQTPKGTAEMIVNTGHKNVQKKWVNQIKNLIVEVNMKNGTEPEGETPPDIFA